jgi:hypothetical protein
LSEQNEQVTPEVTPEKPQDESKGSSITSLDDALKVINDLRAENAAKRVKAKEVEEKAAKWEEYVQSQKTELERLTESKTALEKQLADLQANQLRDLIAKEVGVPEELIEFLTGADEQTLRANAKKLASVKQGSETTAGKGKTDFFAGQRGTPVSKPAEGLNEFFKQMWKESEENSRTSRF